MKLKLVVVSMSILGLVSYPAFADHGKKYHTTKTAAYKDYKGSKDYKDYKDGAIQPIEPVCTISQDTMILTTMTQNMNRSIPSKCNPGWFNRLQFAGGVNIDMLKAGNRNANIQGENYQRVSLNDAYLSVAAEVNEWAKAFASISYSNPTIAQNLLGLESEEQYNAQYSSPYNGLSTRNFGGTEFILEQGYVTLGNFEMSPVFIQLGKQYQDFSRYEIHPITRSITQSMSEILTTSAKIGFIFEGFNGSVYAFDNVIGKTTGGSEPFNPKSYAPTNYGVALGYEQPSDLFGWDIGAAYIYNIIGAQDIANAVDFFNFGNGYNNRVGGAALYADINSGPFVLGARYTEALSRFNPADLPRYGFAEASGGVVSPTASGAEPWGFGLQAGYGFNVWDKNQNIYLGYQSSTQAAGLALPKHRYVAGYGIDVVKYTTITAEWDHDNAYGTTSGGTGDTTNLVSVRAAVKFG